MHKVVHVEPLEGYRLRVEFDDGHHGVVDLTDRLLGPMFEPLRNRLFFAKVTIDEYGVVCWPNGADLAPDALYENLASAPVGK